MASRSDGRRTALVTGAGGFTGRYVGQALARAGFDVVGWTHGDASADDGLLPVDLTDRNAVGEAVARARPDVVLHLAAIAFVAHGDASDIYRVNVIGSRHLLEAIASLETAPRNVILASSANIYGNAAGRLGEDTPPSPQNDYAVSKLAMEHMARLWADRVPLTLVRPFNYTGVGQSERFLIPKIVKHFRDRADVIELGNLDVWREFNDVRDVAGAYATLAGIAGTGEAFNLCSGEEYSLRDVLAMMETIAGHRLEVRVNPAFVRSHEVERLCGDDRKLSAAIGPQPRTGLAQTLRWMYEAPSGAGHAA